MRIIAIANQKGGTGKTTTAINLSAAIAQQNRKILLIDMDPRAHASNGLNVKTYELKKNIYNVLVNSNAKLEDVVISISPRFDLVPSDIVLSGAEPELAEAVGKEMQLSHAIKKLNRHYDYVFIDCPPSLGILTFNALAACNELIIPVETGFFALQGVNKLLEVVDIIGSKLNHHITVYALATIFDCRTDVSGEILNNLKGYFKEKTLNTVININVKLKETAGKGVHIFDYDSNSRGAEDYLTLAKEIIALEKGVEQSIQH